MSNRYKTGSKYVILSRAKNLFTSEGKILRRFAPQNDSRKRAFEGDYQLTFCDEIFDMAKVFAGELSEDEEGALFTLCAASEGELLSRLRPDVELSSCKQSLISAACWLAIAAFSTGRQPAEIGAFTAGEFSVSFGATGASAECLRAQAELMMAPYTYGGFSFSGVRA